MGQSVKMVEYNFPQVDEDGSIFTGTEDGVDQFFLEHNCTKILVDNNLIFDTFDQHNCFNFNGFSFAADYDQIKIDSDALDSYLTFEGEETKLEFVDGSLEGVEVFQENNSFQGKHEDGLSDCLTEEVQKSDNGPGKESRLESVGSDRFSSAFSGRDCVAETSKFSSISVSVLESSYNQSYPLQEQMTVQEMHKAFRSKFGYETLITDRQWLKQHILCGSQNHIEINNDLDFSDCCVIVTENVGSTLFSSSAESPRATSCSFIGASDDKNMPGVQCVAMKLSSCDDSITTSSSEVSRIRSDSLNRGDMGDPLVAQKRLRKPTKRYIEESLEHDSRFNIRKCGISYKGSGDKVLQVKSHKQPCQRAQQFLQDEMLNVACIQVPFGLPIEEGNFKKNMPSSGNDSEDCKDNELSVSNDYEMDSFPVDSLDESCQGDCAKMSNNGLKGMKPRKHHKSWSPTEVVKLIEGVSMYGVGRWTEIKRLLFPSSTHRTSVDLKDKWRNLLKASCSQLQTNREVEQGRRTAHQVPKYILRRVKELAAVYPYPKEGKSKVSCTGSPFPVSTTNMLMPLSAGVGG